MLQICTFAMAHLFVSFAALPVDFAAILFQALVKSSVLLLVTLVVSLLLRKRSAATIHGLWALGVGAALAIPVIAIVAPSWSLRVLPRSSIAVGQDHQGSAIGSGLAITPRIQGNISSTSDQYQRPEFTSNSDLGTQGKGSKAGTSVQPTKSVPAAQTSRSSPSTARSWLRDVL